MDRDVVQIATWLVYCAIMGVLAFKFWRHHRSWLVFVPLAVNVALTIAFYLAIFIDPPAVGHTSYSDWSAALRLETGLTLLYYAIYLPLGLGGRLA